MKREVKYPVFIECSKLCGEKEVFWKFVFEDMAFEKFPPCVYIQKDYLCCSSKDKEFVYKLMENGEMVKSTEQIYEDVRKLLQNRACLLSDKEALFQRKNVLHCRQAQFERERYNEESWNVIRKKIIKENLMEEYVLESRNKFGLDGPQVKRLFSLLILGFLFKTIHSKDVSYSNGYIQSIEGFDFTPQTVTCTKNIYMNDFPSLHFSIHPSSLIQQETSTKINHHLDKVNKVNKVNNLYNNTPPPSSSSSNVSNVSNVSTSVPGTLSSHWVKYLSGLTPSKRT